MSKQNDTRNCSKCNVSSIDNSWTHYRGSLSSPCSRNAYCMDCQKRLLLNKDGKPFCFNCLVSEYDVNCQYCHKRINSKDELAYWGGGILSIDGDYDYCKADDRVFTCWGCDEKIREKVKNGIKMPCVGWGPILFPENRKCRIVGCSQKPYYECVDLCLPHSKPCKGGKVKPNGGRCNAAMGVDEGDICEFCQNQIETYQQQKDGLENESNREGRNGSRTIRKDNLPASNSTSPSPQPITNSNSKNDNSVSSSNSLPNPILEIKVVNSGNNQSNNSSKPVDGSLINLDRPGQQENNQTLVISLENIKKIILVGDNLVVEFNQGKNSQVVDSEQVCNMLAKVKSHLQTNHLSSICNQELVNLLSQKNTDESPNSSTLSSQIPWMAVLSVSGILITIGLVFLIVKFKRSPSKKKIGKQ